MAINLVPDVEPLQAAQDSAALRRVFEALTPASCPHSYNFHMHTVCSDGRLQPEQLMDQAIALGLKGFAITDHHSVNGFRRAQQWLASQQENNTQRHFPRFWSGMEINAELLGDEVHILAYAFDPDHTALAPYRQGNSVGAEWNRAVQVITAIHNSGGLAVLAHPARYRRSAAELIPAAAEAGIDGIETFYAYNNPNPWQPSPRQTEEICQLGITHGLFSTCGTDTHGLSILQRL